MAIIYSYPLNDNIKPLDELVGTTEHNINGQLRTVTRNFLLSDLAEFFIVDGGLQKEITLTTNNTGGPATLNQTTGVLNIPQYAGLQNLQQVLDSGRVATSLDGESSITLLDYDANGNSSVNFLLADVIDPSKRGLYDFSAEELNLTNESPTGATTIKSFNNKITLSEGNLAGTTNLQFETPTANTELKLPAKGVGTYTIATLDDITSGSGTDPLALKIANNLSDLANASTARTNLGLGTLATQNLESYTTKSGDAYTFALGDANTQISFTSANTTPTILTMPTNASVAFSIGTKIKLFRTATTSFMTLSGSGVDFVSYNGTPVSTINLPRGISVITKVDTNRWQVEYTPDWRFVGSSWQLSDTINTFNVNVLVTSGSVLTPLVGGVTDTQFTFGDTASFNRIGGYTNTAGNKNALSSTITFNPTSGTGTFNAFNFSPIINQTGGANGITRALYINPTLTSAVDFRALEITRGKIYLPPTLEEGAGTEKMLVKDSSTGQVKQLDIPSGGSGSTNLSATYAPTTVTIVSSSGTNAIVNAVDNTNAGIVTTTQKADWDAKQTASQVQTIADAKVSDTAYNATSWNGVTDISPSKNAIRDKFESTGLTEILAVNNTTTYNIIVDVSATAGLNAITATTDDSVAVQANANLGTAISGSSVGGVAGSFSTAVGNTSNIVDFTNAGLSNAFIDSNAKLTATDLKATNQTASTIASFDADKNVVSLPTATYPSLTELTYSKGVTSAIQPQLNGKSNTGHTHTASEVTDFNSATRAQTEAELVAGSNITITPSGTGAARQLTIASTGSASTQGAYTVLANNTNATATPTEQVFKSVAEQTYIGAITQTAGAAATGATAHTYQWTQIGKLVTLQLNIDFATAGTTVTAINCELPSDLPTPIIPSSVTAVNQVICYGFGTMSAANQLSVATPGTASLRTKSVSPNVFEISIQRGSGNYANAYATITYLAQ